MPQRNGAGLHRLLMSNLVDELRKWLPSTGLKECQILGIVRLVDSGTFGVAQLKSILFSEGDGRSG